MSQETEKTYLDDIVERYGDQYAIMTADGFDHAVIGFSTEGGVFRLIYSVDRCLQKLMAESSMTLFEAREFFDYNVICAYVGPLTPIWCVDDF